MAEEISIPAGNTNTGIVSEGETLNYCIFCLAG